MLRHPLHRFDRLIWVGTLLLAVWLLTFHEIWDRDIFFHIATGKQILANGGLLRENVFTWPDSTLPFYHNPSWLFQLVSALLYRWGGFAGVVLFKCAVLMLAFWVGFRTLARAEVSQQWSVLFLIVAALASAFRFNERPQVVSYLCFALFVHILSGYLRGENKRLFWLPVITLLWANFHSGFVFGLAYLALTLLGEGGNLLRREGEGRARFVALVKLFPVVACASLLTPQPLANYRFLYQHLHVNKVLPVAEYATAGIGEFLWFYLLGALALGAGVIGRRLGDTARLLPFCFFFVLAVLSVRFIPYFAFAALPLAAPGLARLPGRWTEGEKSWLGQAATLLLPLVVLTLVWRFPPVPAQRTIAINPKMTPLAAFAFLDANPATGRFYNSLSYGAAGMFYLYPKYRLYQSSYIQVEEDLMAEAFSSAGKPETWSRFLDKHGIQVALIDPGKVPPTRAYFPKQSWALVFFDGGSAIFLRRGVENEGLIEQFEYKVISPEFFEGAYGGRQTSVDLGNIAQGAEELSRALHWSPGSPLLHLMLGYYLGLGAGSDEEALAAYSNALELDPRLAPAYFQKGIILRDQGRIGGARQAMETYIRLNPEDQVGYFELGRLYSAEGESERAKKVLYRGLKLGADSRIFHLLGNLHREAKELEAAIENYRLALNGSPADPVLRNDFGVALGMNGDIEVAVEQFDRALALRPGYAEAMRNRTYALQILERERRK